MIYSVFSIRDVKSGFLAPVFESNRQIAMRNFSHAVCSSQDVLRTFAPDYSLYEIGTFDTDSGLLSSFATPVYLFSAVDALSKPGEVPDHV